MPSQDEPLPSCNIQSSRYRKVAPSPTTIAGDQLRPGAYVLLHIEVQNDRIYGESGSFIWIPQQFASIIDAWLDSIENGLTPTLRLACTRSSHFLSTFHHGNFIRDAVGRRAVWHRLATVIAGTVSLFIYTSWRPHH